MTKTCIICGEALPIERFPENRRMPDGHLDWCLDCWKFRGTAEYHKQQAELKLQREEERKAKREKQKAYKRAWREKNREKVATYQREYHQTRKGEEAYQEARKISTEKYRKSLKGRAARAAAQRAWYERNGDALRTKARERYYANKDKILAQQKEYRQRRLQIAK